MTILCVSNVPPGCESCVAGTSVLSAGRTWLRSVLGSVCAGYSFWKYVLEIKFYFGMGGGGGAGDCF